LGMALLMLQNWARLLCVVLSGLSAFGAAGRAVTAHSLADVLAEAVPCLFLFWVVWYLLLPEVKAVFNKA
jgi:hypothetical protein